MVQQLSKRSALRNERKHLARALQVVAALWKSRFYSQKCLHVFPANLRGYELRAAAIGALFRSQDGLPSFWNQVLAGHDLPSFSATSVERLPGDLTFSCTTIFEGLALSSVHAKSRWLNDSSASRYIAVFLRTELPREMTFCNEVARVLIR